MKSEHLSKKRLRGRLVLFLVALVVTAPPLSAQTWMGTTSNWDDGSNWSPIGVPTGVPVSGVVATFDGQGTDYINIPTAPNPPFVLLIALDGILFTGSTSYTIDNTDSGPVNLNVEGVVNGSSVTQNFIADVDDNGNAGQWGFGSNASAGTNTTYTNEGGTSLSSSGGATAFFDTSDASDAVFSNMGGLAAVTGDSNGGFTSFADNTTADYGTFYNYGGDAHDAGGGSTSFSDYATAAHGTFTSYGTSYDDATGGMTSFFGNSTAGYGTFTNYGGKDDGEAGGSTQFSDYSNAANGTYYVYGGQADGADGGYMEFWNSSTAGGGVFYVYGSEFDEADGGNIGFNDGATAGLGTFYIYGATDDGEDGGSVDFSDGSTAGNGTFYVSGATDSGLGRGSVTFFDNSTAGSGTFNVYGGTADGADGGQVQFQNGSNAGNASFTVYGATVNGALGGSVQFLDNSFVGSATFTVDGGTVNGAQGGSVSLSGEEDAGNAGFVINGGQADGASGGSVLFQDQSSADDATFTVNGAAFSGAQGGTLMFVDESSAGDGIYDVYGGTVDGGGGGSIEFSGDATANGNTLTAHGGTISGADGGLISFGGSSTTDHATLIADAGTDGGRIEFRGMSEGDGATVEVYGNGSLDISAHKSPGVDIRFLSGSGNVYLGDNNLSLDGNTSSIVFSGVIQDGGVDGGTGGSLTQAGDGTLILTDANTYTGGTTISDGALQLGNGGTSGSITGDVTDDSSLVFDRSDTVTYSGAISGGGSVTQMGTGTLIISGNDGYSGGTDINAGTVDLEAIAGILAPGSSLTFNGTGSFDYDNTGASLTTVDQQSLGAVTFNAGDGTVTSILSTSKSTTLILASVSRATGAAGNFVVDDNSDGATNGTDSRIVISGQTTGFMDPALFFDGNDYAYYDSNGYVRGINYGVDPHSLVSSGGSTITGTLKASTNVEITGAITAQTSATIDTLNMGNNSLTLANGETLTVNGILESGGSATLSGGDGIAYGNYPGESDLVVRTDEAGDSLTIDTLISAANLTKSGAGTLNLDGIYNGATYVDDGTLGIGHGNTVTGNVTVNNSSSLNLNGTIVGNVSVNAGASVGGSGSIKGSIIVAGGGSTYPGDPQILSANNIEYQNGSTAQFSIATTGGSSQPPTPGVDYDQLKLTGGPGEVLQIDPGLVTLQLNLTSTSLAALETNAANDVTDNYFLFSLGSGTSTGEFSEMALTEGATTYTEAIVNGVATFTQLGLELDVSYTSDAATDSLLGGHDVALSAYATPEPSTYALMLGGLALLGFCARRKLA